MEKASIILFITVMFGNVCNYLFQLFTGRYLTAEEFGILNSLFSIFVISSVPGNAIQLTTAKCITNLIALNKPKKLETVVNQILFYTICLSCMFFVLGIAFQDEILKFLLITNKYAYLIVLLSMALTLPLTVFIGILQGRQKFIKLGVFGSGQAVVKLLLASTAIILGLNFKSIISSILLSVIIILVLIVIVSKKEFNNREEF